MDGHSPSGLRAPGSADSVEALDKIYPLRLLCYIKRFPPHLCSVKRSKGKPSREANEVELLSWFRHEKGVAVSIPALTVSNLPPFQSDAVVFFRAEINCWN